MSQQKCVMLCNMLTCLICVVVIRWKLSRTEVSLTHKIGAVCHDPDSLVCLCVLACSFAHDNSVQRKGVKFGSKLKVRLRVKQTR